MSRDLASFEPLWPAERRLAEEIPSGALVSLGEDLPPADAPDGVRVRASFLRYLALGGCSGCRPSAKGVRIRGAYIQSDGKTDGSTQGLDLEGCDLPHDLWFVRCRFTEQILARAARGQTIALNGSHLPLGFSAERLRLEGSLLLRNAHVAGIVRINAVKIAAGVDFDGSYFHAGGLPDEEPFTAIVAEGAEIAGNLSMRSVDVYGTVRMSGSDITGDVYLFETTITAPLDAVKAAGTKVGGSILVYDSRLFGEFSAEMARVGGLVGFDDTKIFAQIDQFGHPTNAIGADGMDVRGDFSFRNAEINGKSRLYNVRIGASLDCTSAKFRAIKSTDARSDLALSASRLTASSVILDNADVRGRIAFSGGHIGNFTCENARLHGETSIDRKYGPSLHADGLIVDGTFVATNVDSRGEFRLLGSKIGRDLNAINGVFSDGNNYFGPPGFALSLDAASVGSRVRLNKVRVDGTVTLLGARVERDLDCEGARIVAEDRSKGVELGIALKLGLSVIKGGVYFRDATIRGTLDAEAAEFGVIHDDPVSWPPKGHLSIDRCKYQGFGKGTSDARTRLSWLDLQFTDQSEFLPQPYEQLAKVLRYMGHGDDAVTVLIEKERRSRAAENSRKRGLARLGHWGWTQALRIIGYGYRPHRAIWPAAAFVFVGAVLVCYANAQGVMLPTTIPVKDTAAPRLVPLIYSFESFVPFIDLDQFRAFRPDMSTPLGWWVRVYLWIHAMVGWVIGGVAAAGVLGLFQRT
ncbi:MAG: hypothetical protein ABTQ27_04250 [Amaricoccus sp.]|uniref:hypothetical protein n=1 Tax=Amaricoccus sp. TaxID=1872485 RepID=UPI00331457AD